MRQTWRWFGPDDPISIGDLLQVGVEGVVTALHHIPPGQVWPADEIARRQAEIAVRRDGTPTGLDWQVVESLPVSEDIKTQSGDVREHLDAYRTSLRNLAEAGLRTLCYNFMPVLDWTRTNLNAPMAHGGTAMRFDLVEFAAFDLHLLERPGAAADYGAEVTDAARRYFAALSADRKTALERNVVAGLPGANDRWSLDDVRARLAAYDQIDADRLRRHLVDFLAEVAPVAEEVGINLCAHPDDPPFPLMGLPRVLSGLDDYQALVDAVDIPQNGVTLCTGSLGVAADFDAVAFVERLGPRIHFAHLRNTTRTEPAAGRMTSFYEAAHLEGQTDMVGVIGALLAEEARRRHAGRKDHSIPFRPDHGQVLLTDRDGVSLPGYPLIGRMRGLAELRGILAALSASEPGAATV